jgi:hypothetical protein
MTCLLGEFVALLYCLCLCLIAFLCTFLTPLLAMRLSILSCRDHLAGQRYAAACGKNPKNVGIFQKRER